MINLLMDTLFSIIIVFLFFYLINKTCDLYSTRLSYPTGPIPLPIIGNLLMMFKNLNRHPVFVFEKLAQKYGDVYTFWLGTEPVIVINDIEVAKRMFNKPEYSDRFDESVAKGLNDFGHTNFALNNYDDEWRALRKLASETIRKFLLGNSLSVYLRKIVDENVDNMIKNHECGKPFLPFKYIDSIFVRLLAQTTYGQQTQFNSTNVNQVLDYFKVIDSNMRNTFSREFIPLMNLIRKTSAHNPTTIAVHEITKHWFSDCFNSNHSSGQMSQTLYDLMNSIRIRYLDTSDDEVYKNYLSDENIVGTLISIFFGASGTTHYTFKWILLFMAYYPHMQTRMREEIELNIGIAIPEVSDKEKCHFVNAFICETLRFRNPTALVIHKSFASNDGIKKIPKHFSIAVNQHYILNDTKYWTKPNEFIPQRFIDSNGCFDKTHLPAFIPFSTGKRMCIGDKFAMNTLFLTLTRLLQATQGYQILLANRQYVNFDPKPFGFFIDPKEYQIYIIKDCIEH